MTIDTIRLLIKPLKNRDFLVTDNSKSNRDGKNIAKSFKQSTMSNQSVVVILPVYRNVEMTRRCIRAAMPGILTTPNAIMLAINDASPENGMQAMLAEFAAMWPEKFVLLENSENLGFVRTVNRGLAYDPDSDVVLLNSDVIVPQDWLARLIEEAYSLANVATVTPFSNNATICSFPVFLEDNNLLFGLDVDGVDLVFRKYKLPCVEAPTGVGFCMYIRRTCLNRIGYLNEERFGRGYGEENDLCQRALKAGFVNLITPNLFAFHEGGVSFSTEKQALIEKAMHVIDELHPNYHYDVQEFIKDDPLKPQRISRYIQLLSVLPIPKILCVSHEMGGGVQQHIEELNEYYGNKAAFLLLRPFNGEKGVVIRLIIGRNGADELSFSMPDDYNELVALLKTAGVSLVHFHHTHGLNPMIWSLPAAIGVHYILTVHDFYWLSGNPTLTNEDGCFVETDYDELKNPLFPLPKGVTAKTWREKHRPLIEDADMVIFPSYAAKKIFGNSYKFKDSIVAPHIEIERNVAAPAKPFKSVGTVTVGVLGALGREKGADFLEEVAVAAQCSEYKLKFTLIGYAYRPLKAVVTTGPYKLQELSRLISEHKIDLIFFPARWPETYSYTLSYALDSGLPIVAPDIGVFPERLSGRENVLLFKHGVSASELLVQLGEFIEKLAKGEQVCAPLYNDDNEGLLDHEFYASAYLDVAAKSLRVRDVAELVPLQLPSRLYRQIALERTALNRRERLLSLLWRIYNQPYINWVARLIPFKIKRAIKRALSTRPIHEIAERTK